MLKNFNRLTEFMKAFPDEKSCRQYFEQIRFAGGDFCPHCKHNKITHFKDGMRYRCKSNKCRKDFTIKTGTIFGESKLPLQTWFIAIYLLTTRKKGISSVELAKQLGVTQKTSWFIDHRIREALKQGKGKLFGTTEIDETYIGGKHNRRYGFKKKAPVMGMTQRKGKLKAFHIPSRETHIIFEQIKKYVDPKAMIMTDEAHVYKKLPKLGYRRGGVTHGKMEFVRGDIHTNSIESFWALFKRGYHGTYHSMSKKHLQRYVNEFVYRFNNRDGAMQILFDDVTRRLANNRKISYKALTA